MGDENWKLVGGSEVWGGSDSIGVRVLMRYSRKPTADEGHAIYRSVESIIKMMQTNTIKADPEHIQARTKERTDLLACFGERAIFVEEIPNGYMKDDPYFSNYPWYRVTTSIGHLVIGWRKRVIAIDWESTVVGKHADMLFPDHDVTKDRCMIHAYSYEKALAIIDTLHTTAPAYRPGTTVRLTTHLHVYRPPHLNAPVKILEYIPYSDEYKVGWIEDPSGDERDYRVAANVLEPI